MAVIQEAFFIPDDIAIGVLDGKYKIFGGVVRHAIGPNKGQIVKHLKPVNMKEAGAAQRALAKVAHIAEANPKAAIAVGVGAVIVGGSTFVFKKIKNREPAILTEFRKNLNQYLEAIRSGNMDLEVIHQMVEALQELKQHKEYKRVSFLLTAEDIEIFVNKIQEYTIKLASDNGIEIENVDTEKSDDAILDFEKYLNIQKRVFEEAV